jgi:hypothetical protein
MITIAHESNKETGTANFKIVGKIKSNSIKNVVKTSGAWNMNSI